MSLSLSQSLAAARAAGAVAHRSLGTLAQSRGALAQQARSLAYAVGLQLDDLGPAQDASQGDDPLSLAHDAGERDHAFARGDLRSYREALHRLADGAAAEVDRVRELALALPLVGGQPGGLPAPVANGTLELHDGEIVHPLAPCADADCPRCAPLNALDEGEEGLLPTLEETLAAEAEADEAAAREQYDDARARFGAALAVGPERTPEQERAVSDAAADMLIAAGATGADEAEPPLGVPASPAGGKRPRRKGRGRKGA